MRIRNRTAVVLAAAGAMAALTALPAAAHVNVDADEATAGTSTRLTFGFSHGCDGAATNELEVQIPDGVVVSSPQWVAGFDLAVHSDHGHDGDDHDHNHDHDGDDHGHDGDDHGHDGDDHGHDGDDHGHDGDDHGHSHDHGDHSHGTGDVAAVVWSGGPVDDAAYAEFSMDVVLPDEPGTELAFPSIQRCENGAEYAWTQVAGDGETRAELDAPAPVLTIEAADAHDDTDDVASATDLEALHADLEALHDQLDTLDSQVDTAAAADNSQANSTGIGAVILAALAGLAAGAASGTAAARHANKN